VAVSQIYLSGGPCDGKTVSANEITGGLVGYIACGGGYYTANTAGRKHSGDLIFNYAGKTKPSPPGGGTVKAPRAHKGWADMQRSVNQHWPAAMRRSEHHLRAAWRSVGKARKVHH
jgi:hypothetical protein